MKRILIFLPVFFLLLSCERDADIELPETEPELVISCFITPQDSFIRARITRSVPVFNTSSGNAYNPVSNATVTLYGNSSSIQLTYNTINQYYEASTSVFPIIAGNEYRIDATHPSGNHAYATTVVPLNPPAGFQCSATDTVRGSDPWNSYTESRFEYSFNDPAGQQDFYRFMVYNRLYDSLAMDTTLDKSGWEIHDDANADGTNITHHATMWHGFTGTELVGYNVWLLHCNYDYYMFHRSIYNYSGGGDPFSEPTQIYSNVTDGLGIFAAANTVQLNIPR